VNKVTISIHPDDDRTDAVMDFLRTRFPEISELTFRRDPFETRPRAIAITPDDALMALIGIDSALFRQFSTPAASK
jgi:hypothetical protein